MFLSTMFYSNKMYVDYKFKLYFSGLFSILPISLVLGTLVSEFVILLINILFLSILFKKKNFGYFFSKIEYKLLFVLYFYLIFSLIFSSNFFSSFTRNFFFIRFIIFFISFRYLIDNKFLNINFIFKFWLVILIIFVFNLYWEYFFGKDLFGNFTELEGRLAGFMGKELKAGHFILGFGLPIISFFLPKHYKLIFIAAVPILLSAQFIIGERANFLKFCFIVLLFLIFYKHFSFKKKLLCLIFGAVFLFSIMQFGDQKIKYRYNFNNFFGSSETNIYSLYLKTQYGEHYLTTLEILKNNLYFGVGNKNFRHECQKYQAELIINKNTSGIGCATHPHQIYYEILSEHGIIGFCIFIVCFLVLIILNLKNIKLENYVKVTCLFFIISTFIPILPSGSFFTSFGATIFWINFSLFFSFNNLKN